MSKTQLVTFLLIILSFYLLFTNKFKKTKQLIGLNADPRITYDIYVLAVQWGSTYVYQKVLLVTKN